ARRHPRRRDAAEEKGNAAAGSGTAGRAAASRRCTEAEERFRQGAPGHAVRTGEERAQDLRRSDRAAPDHTTAAAETGARASHSAAAHRAVAIHHREDPALL